MAVLIPRRPGMTYIMSLGTDDRKNLLPTGPTRCTQVLLLIFINYKEDEKQRNYVCKVVVSYPQWQVHITVHNAQAVMSVSKERKSRRLMIVMRINF